jgi:hypothetical protein
MGEHSIDAAVDLEELVRNSRKSLVEVDDVVGCGAFAGHTTNIVGVVRCSNGAGGVVVTKESIAESGYHRSKSGSFR